MAIYIGIKTVCGGTEFEYCIADGETTLLFRRCDASKKERKKIVKEIDQILEKVYGN